MNLNERKIIFIQDFLRIKDEEVVVELEKLLRESTVELFCKGNNPLTKEQYNAEIDQAMEDSKNGRMIKASELKAKVKQWD